MKQLILMSLCISSFMCAMDETEQQLSKDAAYICAQYRGLYAIFQKRSAPSEPPEAKTAYEMCELTLARALKDCSQIETILAMKEQENCIAGECGVEADTMQIVADHMRISTLMTFIKSHKKKLKLQHEGFAQLIVGLVRDEKQ